VPESPRRQLEPRQGVDRSDVRVDERTNVAGDGSLLGRGHGPGNDRTAVRNSSADEFCAAGRSTTSNANDEEENMTIDGRRRWIALIVLCLGTLMIVLDTTIVNVALPSIREDLGFSETSLAWVVNAYMLTFGGFLLLGGRLGDLFGHRRLFLMGITLFTLASLACGLATTQGILVAARAIQGLGGAVTSAVSLSLIMMLFTDVAERTKAMGVFGFVAAGGGTIGVLLGGVLTDVLNWHWIFLVNVPIGVGVCALALRLLPGERGPATAQRLDVAGAVTVTVSLMLAVYAIVNGNQAGWTSAQTLGLLAGSVVLLASFIGIEARVRTPLMPLGLFRLRNVATANVAGVLWAAAMFAWFFMSALYLQRVLGYSPLEVGLAFLPTSLIMGVFSLGLSAKLVMRFGLRAPLAVGLTLAAIGLALLVRAPVDGTYAVDVLASMILLGFGAGMAFNPLLMAAMNDVAPTEAGLASGLVNTAFMMGGALGLAVLASVADRRTDSLRASGDGPLAALNGGYHVAFLVGAIFALGAAAIGAALLRARAAAAHPYGESALESAPAGAAGRD
jgi:EmrB/QacA subfamily drug resistance transporter